MAGTVFLDRDGTLNVKAPEGEYVTAPDELELLPGAAQAVARLNAAGARVVIATNQRGIARGRMTPADLEAVHAKLARELAQAGAHVDAIFACPHDHGECDCRKPGIGLFRQARDADPDIDFADSVMVGDSPSDVEAGRAAGMATVGIGPRASGADHHSDDLASAVDWILSRSR
jgi:D-glycero-D-manno-heptose 1,7-bisphosphate phosphatase